MKIGRGSFFALVSIFCGVASGLCLKLTHDVANAQAIAIRAAFAVLILTAIATIWTRPNIRTNRPTVVRALFDTLAGMSIAFAFFELPLSLLTAFLAALPAFSTLAAAYFLAEKPGRVAWIGMGGAFVGCLAILKPALDFSGIGVALTVLGVVGYAARDVFTRKHKSALNPQASVLISMALIGLFSLVIAPPMLWTIPTQHDLLILLVSGTTVVGAGMLILLAHQHSTVSQIAPLRFTSILWAAGFDWLLWGYLPDVWAWLGIGIIALSVLAILRQNYRNSLPKRPIR